MTEDVLLGTTTDLMRGLGVVFLLLLACVVVSELLRFHRAGMARVRAYEDRARALDADRKEIEAEYSEWLHNVV